MHSRLYISITTYIKYNQKVAAEGDYQLAELTLPILFKSVMFEYCLSSGEDPKDFSPDQDLTSNFCAWKIICDFLYIFPLS